MHIFSRKQPPPPSPVFADPDPEWQRPADLTTITDLDLRGMTVGEISAFEQALRRDDLQLKAQATALGAS